MMASFLSWSSGMKLDPVTTCATSGNLPTRSPKSSASFKDGARISAVYGVVIGSFIRSRAVATDSLFAVIFSSAASFW